MQPSKATAGHMRHAATSAAADKAVTVVVSSDDDNKTGSESPNVQSTPKLAKAGSISSASATPASQKRAPVHAPVILIALFVVKCSLILCCSSRKVKLLQKPLQPRPKNHCSLSPKILSSPDRRYHCHFWFNKIMLISCNCIFWLIFMIFLYKVASEGCIRMQPSTFEGCIRMQPSSWWSKVASGCNLQEYPLNFLFYCFPGWCFCDESESVQWAAKIAFSSLATWISQSWGPI